MKSNLLLLTKVHLAGMTGLNRLRYSRDGRETKKAVLFFALYLFVIAVMLALVSVYAVLFAKSGLNDAIPALSFALSAAVILFFSLVRGPHMLFAMKDYDLLMSLPVKKSDVIASRLITSYLVNFVFCAAIMLPCAVVYFIYGSFSAVSLLLILAAMLLCPIVPIAVADVIGTLITAATMNMRYKSVFYTIFAMLALVAAMGVSFLFSYTSAAETIDIGGETIDKILAVYPPAWLFQKSLTGNGAWHMPVLAAASIALAAVFVAVLSKFYLQINCALLSRKDKGKFDGKKLKAGSPFAALYKNEFARLLSSPVFMVNALSGILILAIISIASFFVDPFALIAQSSEVGAAAQELKYLAIPIAMLMIGMSMPSASALSLEGGRRWIPFSMPVSSFQILLAKAMMPLTLTGTAGVLCSCILTFTWSFGGIQAALLFISVIVYALFSSFFGIFINTKFTKYDWTTETAVVKNSASVTISVFAGMIPPFAVLFLGFSLFDSLLYPLIALDGLALAAAAVCFFLLRKAEIRDR